MGNKGGKPVLREEDLKALASTSGLRQNIKIKYNDSLQYITISHYQ